MGGLRESRGNSKWSGSGRSGSRGRVEKKRAGSQGASNRRRERKIKEEARLNAGERRNRRTALVR